MARIKQIQFTGEQSSAARCRIGLDAAYKAWNCTVDKGIIEPRSGYTLFGARTSANAGDICWGAGHGKYTGNETQRLYISGSPTGGTFSLTFSGQTASGIAYNATADTVKSALESLSNINIGDIYVSGNDLPTGPISITFGGQYANTDVAAITSSSSLTGGTPVIHIDEIVKGGSFEEIIVAIQKNGETDVTMYSVNVSTGAYTELVDGLDASNWYFEQYDSRIYALNGIDGLHYKPLGGTWNNGVSTEPPAAPLRSPQPSDGSWYGSGGTEYGVSSVSGFSGFGTNPTATIIGAENVQLKFNASITSPTLCTFDMVLSSNDAFQLRDLHLLAYLYPTGQTGTVISADANNLEFINADVSPATISPPYSQTSTVYTAYTYYQFVGTDRDKRDNVAKIKVSLYIEKASKGNSVTVSVRHYNSWPLSYDPPDMSACKKPTGKLPAGTVKYAYCYYRTSDASYSALSPEVTISVPAMALEGYYIKGTVDVSPELSGSDKIMLYRYEKSTGKWRLIKNTDISTYGYANTGTGGLVQFTDAWMEHELADFPEYPNSIIGSWPTSSFKSASSVGISSWKRSLAIGTRYLLLVSAINKPETFMPSPDDYDAASAADSLDETIGVTEYAAANRAEEIIGIAGQDALYIATYDSVYAKIGDTPLSATPPRRFPGSRGPVGTRASCRFMNGMLCASEDGLWIYSASRGFSGIDDGSDQSEEATKHNRDNWTEFLGDSYSGLSLSEKGGAVYACNGTDYYSISKNGAHTRGEYADSIKMHLPVRGIGMLLADSKGRLLLLDDAAEDDAGTDYEWSYETGDEDFPTPAKIRSVTVAGNGNPRVAVEVWDGARGYVKRESAKMTGRRTVIPIACDAGQRIRLSFAGGTGDTVESAYIEMDGVPQGRYV